MNNYTIHNNQKINEQIHARLMDIVQFILVRIPDIYSIILTGGFGKGEGSIKIINGDVIPLRDFDFVIIFHDKIPYNKIIKIKKEINNITENLILDPSKYQYSQEFSIDISATTLHNINLFPDVITYDLKNSIVLYGEDIRSLILWLKHDIPLRSGARLLFQKSTALIGIISQKDIENRRDYTDDNQSFIRETSKIYIEIGSVLCIIMKKYESPCAKRLEILQIHFEREFPELKEKIPDLFTKIQNSTYYKLDPQNHPILEDPILFWFKARSDLEIIIKFFFRIYLNITADDWISFTYSLEKKMTQYYYDPLLKKVFKRIILWLPNCILIFINILFNIIENLKSTVIIPNEKFYSIPIIGGISAPSIKLFSICPLILFSINQNGSYNDEYIKCALFRLRFIKITNNLIASPWEIAKIKTQLLIKSIKVW